MSVNFGEKKAPFRQQILEAVLRRQIAGETALQAGPALPPISARASSGAAAARGQRSDG
mgnify:CR=1 FL=1